MASDPIGYTRQVASQANRAATEARPETHVSQAEPALQLAQVTEVGAQYKVKLLASSGAAGGAEYSHVPVVPAGSAYTLGDVVWIAYVGRQPVILAAGGGTCYSSVTAWGVLFG